MITRFALLLFLALTASLSAQTVVSADNSQPPAPSRSVTGSSVGEALASADGLLKASKFTEAAAAYKTIIEKDPTAANAHVGLMRSLLRAQHLTEAGEAGKQAIQAAPLSSLVHATYGDVNFAMGQMGVAEAEYRAALKLDANAARGLYGMGRMYAMVSMHKRAKEVFAKAHQADPNDKQIYEAWVASLPEVEQLEAVKKSAGDHPTEREQQRITFLSKVSANKPWVLAGEPRSTELKLHLYGRTLQDGGLSGPRMIAKGFGVDVKFNDRAGATLLLDTGAGGITIGRKLAEKAGVVKIADTFIRGIGDQGPVASYIGWADKINIGGIEFKNCVVEVSSKTDIADEAGLLGTDVFENFLITLDFKELKLVLAPLPKNPNGPAHDDGPQDRYIAPEMQSFTKVWRFGHFLMLPVVVSDKASGNFILDTGSDTNIVDTKLAKQITKLNYEGYSLKGVSGSVKKEVLNGDKAILQFGKLRVRSDDIPVIDLTSLGGSEDTELAGLIGIRTLSQMKLTLDYRDGLVNFELYEFRPARE